MKAWQAREPGESRDVPALAEVPDPDEGEDGIIATLESVNVG